MAWQRLIIATVMAVLLAPSALAGSMAADRSADGGAGRTLVIGLSQEPTSLDPHFHDLHANLQVALHVFDTLVGRDETSGPTPQLAESWTTADGVTWEFRLRPGVTFHDGTPFTARDVLYSFCRLAKVPGSPRGFAGSLSMVREAEAPDSHTIRLVTDRPYPLLLSELATLAIIRAPANGGPERYGRDGCGASDWLRSADFDSRRLVVGTGPFRLAAYEPGRRVVLDRNDTSWRGGVPWNRVEMRFIRDDGQRVRALLAREVDIIDQVSGINLENLSRLADVRLIPLAARSLFYLHLDTSRNVSPGVEAPDGRTPLKANPLKDRRVRRALSLAIDRQAIVDRVLRGQASMAFQLVPFGLVGHADELRSEGVDLVEARRLLAEAGYPNGFTLHIGLSTARLALVRVAEVVAAMVDRIGVHATVEVTSSREFSSRQGTRGYGAYLAGWANSVNNATDPLKNLLATPDGAANGGFGLANVGGYSNPEVDRLLAQSLVTLDEKRREALLREACVVAMRDQGLVPLYFEVAVWGVRHRLDFIPRADLFTLAADVRPLN